MKIDFTFLIIIELYVKISFNRNFETLRFNTYLWYLYSNSAYYNLKNILLLFVSALYMIFVSIFELIESYILLSAVLICRITIWILINSFLIFYLTCKKKYVSSDPFNNNCNRSTTPELFP